LIFVLLLFLFSYFHYFHYFFFLIFIIFFFLFKLRAEHALRYLGPATRIRDHLYLGSVFDIQTMLNQHQIALEESKDTDNNTQQQQQQQQQQTICKFTHILNVAEEASETLPSSLSKTTKLVVNDIVKEEQELQQQWLIFEKAFEFIEEARKSNGICMVHCMRGRSRSASIVMAYLMVTEKMSLLDAYKEVKKLRPPLGPHHHLKQQLIYFEHKLNSKSTMDMKIWKKLEHQLDTEAYEALEKLKQQQTSQLT